MKLNIETPRRVREYETIYVLRPDVETATAAKIADRVSGVITGDEGTLVKVEAWGARKMAYPVRKFRKGIYVYVRYLGDGKIVSELERNFRMQKDAVLKFMTVKLRDDVDVSEIEVDPEEIKFEEIQPVSAEELHESREKQLGLVEVAQRGQSRRAVEEEEAEENSAEEATEAEAEEEVTAEGEPEAAETEEEN